MEKGSKMKSPRSARYLQGWPFYDSLLCNKLAPNLNSSKKTSYCKKKKKKSHTLHSSFLWKIFCSEKHYWDFFFDFQQELLVFHNSLARNGVKE